MSYTVDRPVGTRSAALHSTVVSDESRVFRTPQGCKQLGGTLRAEYLPSQQVRWRGKV
ncbi:hypothetical protein [Nostoc sp.]|uniref:hypothetical protein n=1 Tax=Nostoc sp. TaxID=1180 RepID=UPI002FF9E7A9